jgi:hypothetical protein
MLWRFTAEAAPHGFWSQLGNQRRYLEWLGKELNLQSPDDWLKVKREEIEKRNGWGVLGHYHGSLFRGL